MTLRLRTRARVRLRRRVRVRLSCFDAAAFGSFFCLSEIEVGPA